MEYIKEDVKHIFSLVYASIPMILAATFVGTILSAILPAFAKIYL